MGHLLGLLWLLYSTHSNPSLYKFKYLNSFLELTATESIAGLTLTSANYKEVVATLKRIGNTQLIVSKHIDALLNLPAINSHWAFDTSTTQWRHMGEGSGHLEWPQAPMVAFWPRFWWANCRRRYGWSLAESSPKRSGTWRNSWI